MTSVHPYKLDSKRCPCLALLSAILRANHRFAANSVDRGVSLFDEAWATGFKQIVSSMITDAEAIAAAARAYATFAMQSMRLQTAFGKERQYKVKTHEQASSKVHYIEQGKRKSDGNSKKISLFNILRILIYEKSSN
jgi:hypothetical protein